MASSERAADLRDCSSPLAFLSFSLTDLRYRSILSESLSFLLSQQSSLCSLCQSVPPRLFIALLLNDIRVIKDMLTGKVLEIPIGKEINFTPRIPAYTLNKLLADYLNMRAPYKHWCYLWSSFTSSSGFVNKLTRIKERGNVSQRIQTVLYHMD